MFDIILVDDGSGADFTPLFAIADKEKCTKIKVRKENVDDVSRCCYCIPAYEPDDRLLELLKNIRDKENQMFDIILVDDGSGADFAPLFAIAQESVLCMSFAKT